MQVHDFNPTVHHYHLKTDIARSLETGAAIKSICGFVGVISAAATGRTSNGTIVVCPLCTMLHADLLQRVSK